MVSFSSLIIGAVAFAGALAMPNAQPSNGTALFSRAGTGSSTGTNNGYYYQVRAIPSLTGVTFAHVYLPVLDEQPG